jgi:hypothetical protein
MNRRNEQGSDEEAGIERLLEKMGDVEQELAFMRAEIDGIREDIAWWLKNNAKEQWVPIQPITSMSMDPLAPDWGERVNRFTAADLPPSAAGKRSQSLPPPDQNGDLATGIDDETQFCCEAPNLQWTGDPQFPGVACKSCGYTVADCGSVVMQPSPEADPDPEPKEQQQALFAEE